MVATRRSTANDTAANRTLESTISNTTDNTIHVLKVSNKKTKNAATTTKLSSTVLEPARLGSISEHDLSLTSPPTSDAPENVLMSTPKRKKDASSHLDSTSSSTLRKLAPKPSNPIGGVLNPILVIDSSSPSQPARAAKRKQQRRSEPHKFLDRGYKQLYSYRPSRPALAPKPANGSTFTGHQSHDIYRMMNAKMSAASEWNTNPESGCGSLAKHKMPFEVQYPISAQYRAQHVVAMNQQQPLYYSHQARQLTEYPLFATHHEEMLWKRVVQYVRECSRPSPRKRRLSDADPDETSVSESEQPTIGAQSSLFNCTPRPSFTSPTSPLTFGERPNNTEITISPDHDPYFDIAQLTEHTSLLTSLLKMYPHSTDQKGLREDIAMLVSVQNQRMRDWMKMESQNARKQSKGNRDGTSSVKSAMSSAVKAEQRLEQEKRKGQDNELRHFISATANMWQDGSGQGVADVFADMPGSSPTTSFDGNLSSPDKRIPRPDNEVSESEDVDLTPNGKAASLNRKVFSP